MLSIDDLKVSSFFQDLKDEYLEKIVKFCNEETYHADDFIVREGEEAMKLYQSAHRPASMMGMLWLQATAASGPTS